MKNSAFENPGWLGCHLITLPLQWRPLLLKKFFFAILWQLQLQVYQMEQLPLGYFNIIEHGPQLAERWTPLEYSKNM